MDPDALVVVTVTIARPADDGGLIDLTSRMEENESYAKNVSTAYPMTNLFTGDCRLGCKSDADEQLILHISFREFVKIQSIQFTAFNQGLNPKENPEMIHLYVNRENFGFEDCNDVEPEQTLELTAADFEEAADPLSLNSVKFQRVKTLTFFIEGNAGGVEVTAIGMLRLFGRPVATTNMTNLKKQGCPNCVRAPLLCKCKS